MTIAGCKKQLISAFREVSLTPQLDAEVLLCHFLGCDKTRLLLNAGMELAPEAERLIAEAAEKRKSGLPVAYITGHKEFYGYDFLVTPQVLIPKPDTEILVELAIRLILEKMDANPGRILTVCDMCTGSGCIAISVLRTLADGRHVPAERLPKFTLADISENALEVAHRNAERLLGQDLLDRVAFVRTNLFEMIPSQFDVILTNPPYVPADMTDGLLSDGRSEPRLALDGDVTEGGDRAASKDGLAVIRRLVPQCREHLAPRGVVLMECGEYNAKKAAAFAEGHGFSAHIHTDLEGQLRVVELQQADFRKKSESSSPASHR